MMGIDEQNITYYLGVTSFNSSSGISNLIDFKGIANNFYLFGLFLTFSLLLSDSLAWFSLLDPSIGEGDSLF